MLFYINLYLFNLVNLVKRFFKDLFNTYIYIIIYLKRYFYVMINTLLLMINYVKSKRFT